MDLFKVMCLWLVTRICWKRKWPSESCSSLISHSPPHTHSSYQNWKQKDGINKATETITCGEMHSNIKHWYHSWWRGTRSIYTLFVNDKHLYTHPYLSFIFLYPKHCKRTNKYARRKKGQSVSLFHLFHLQNLQATNTCLRNFLWAS